MAESPASIQSIIDMGSWGIGTSRADLGLTPRLLVCFPISPCQKGIDVKLVRLFAYKQ